MFWLIVAAALTALLVFSALRLVKSGANGKEPPLLTVGYNPLIGHLKLMFDEQANAPKQRMAPFARPFRETKQPVFALALGPAFLGYRLTIVNDSLLAEKIMKNREFEEHRPLVTALNFAIGSQNLVSMSGEPWRQHRKFLQPLFSRRTLVDSTLSSVCRHARTAFDELQVNIEKNNGSFTPDLIEWLTDMLLAHNAETLFGYRTLGMHSADTRARIRKSFATIMDVVGEILLSPSVAVWQAIRWKKNQELMEAKTFPR